MKTTLKESEVLVKEGKANRQKNVESAGGKLYLTNQRIIFEGHGFNAQGSSASIDLNGCMFVSNGWTKFLGFIPLFPNAIVVAMEDGASHRFSVFGRKKWLEEVQGVLKEA
ncbi:hypothetical protein HVA01_20450 [Halovibrio variabilis]|uniref:GRAM domain-containing protein n=1 Tax=Halovibrio variabilis TaxID=31910 RepID=A0A511UP79_9GAMM|nr:hypothetical protein [Halovibrio variabilis]GEN28399.1 hypothetical protein HVA01_20450 [Halovibrio variabilis]